MEKIKKLILVFCASLLIGCNQSNEAGLVYGDNNAEIEVINYTSFQCPDCYELHNKLNSSLKKYIESGEIKFIEKPIDISRFEFDDLIYKYMTDEQSKDFDFLTKIYETQNEWIVFNNQNDVIEFFSLGHNENKDNISDLKKITNEKQRLELEEVPTMYINGQKIANTITVEEFESKIEEILNAN